MTARLEDLPQTLPIFPLAGAIVLPGVSLPLNIFEPRYLAMTDYALAHDRMIGMIQPKHDTGLFRPGCAGRITSYQETDDGRYLITLKGISRFNVADEKPLHDGGFRLITPDWQSYGADLTLTADDSDMCRDALLDTLRPYLAKMDMNCEQWDNMRSVSCSRLVATLSMICPFAPEEKQMLLEAPDVAARMKVLCAFLEDALSDTSCNGHH